MAESELKYHVQPRRRHEPCTDGGDGILNRRSRLVRIQCNFADAHPHCLCSTEFLEHPSVGQTSTNYTIAIDADACSDRITPEP